MAYINYLRVRGINPVDIKFAEDEIKSGLDRCEKIVFPPTKNLPNVVALTANDPLLRQQIFAMYKVDNLVDARKFYDEAISGKADGRNDTRVAQKIIDYTPPIFIAPSSVFDFAHDGTPLFGDASENNMLHS